MQIHVARGDQELGVFSPDDVRNGLASGQFQPTDYGWAEGRTEWTPLSDFPGLAPTAPAGPRAGAPGPMPSQPRAAAAAPRAAAVAPWEAAVMPTAGQLAPSGLAIASLVCGILSLTFMPILSAFPAVICGHMARSQIKKAPGTVGGGGMALAGLITGYAGMFLGILFILAILASIALPAFTVARTRAQQTLSLSNGRQIAIGCRAYAKDHGGEFPKALDELVPKYLPDAKVLTCPLSGPSVPIGYEYYGGKDSDPGSNILLVSKAAVRGRERVVIHVDGSAEVARNMPDLPPRAR